MTGAVGSTQKNQDELYKQYQNMSQDQKVAATQDMLNDYGINGQTQYYHKGEDTLVDNLMGLGKDIQAALMNGGFDENDGLDDAEKAIYEDIAGLYKSGKLKQTSDLIKALKDMGYNVDVQGVKTTYIQDDKATQKYNDSTAKEGWIQVLTIKDAEGNDIVIADANGNAAIEVEEAMGGMLLNQLYGNIENLGDFEPSNIETSASKGKEMLTSSTLEYNSMSWEEKFYRGLLSNEEIEEKYGQVSDDDLYSLMEKAYKDVIAKKEVEKEENQKEENALTQTQWDNKQEEYVEEFIKEYRKQFEEDESFDEDEMNTSAKDYAKKMMEDKGYKLAS